MVVAQVQPGHELKTETAETQQRGQQAAAAQPGQGLVGVVTQQWVPETAVVQPGPEVACLDALMPAGHYEFPPGPGWFPGMG